LRAVAINKNKILANAQKFAEKGAFDKAIAEYLKIVKEDPEDVRAWLKVGDLYAKKGSRKEATATYLRVAEFYASQGFYLKAVAVYKQILKLDPTVVQVNLRLAELYQQLGLLSDAQSQFEHVAGYFQRSGKTREALEVMQKLIDLDPDNVPSRIKLAELYSKADMRPEAVREFRLAADQLRAQGRVDDLIKVLERLLWHKPDEFALGRELASIYLDRGDTKRALAKLQQCFQANQRDLDTLALLARAFQTIGQIPKTVSVYREMARIFAETGDDAQRRQVLETILALAPNDPETMQALYGGAAPQTYGAPPPQPFSPQSPSIDYSQINDEPSVPLDVEDLEALPGDEPQPYEVQGYDPQQGYDPSYAQQGYDQPYDAQQAYRQQGYDQPQAYDQQGYAQPQGYEEPLVDQPMHTDEVEEEPVYDNIDDYEEVEELGAEDVLVVENARNNGEEVRRLMTETDVFLKYGLYDKAIEHLQKVFELDPINVEAREKLKDLYLQLGEFERAVAELLTLSALFADSDAEAAKYYLHQVLDIAPDHPEALDRLQHVGGGYAAQGEAAPQAEASDLFVAVDDDLLGGFPVTDHRENGSVPIDLGDSSTSTETHRPEHLRDMTLDSAGPIEDELGEQPAGELGVAALEEELEEVEFFLVQGLFDEALNMLHELAEAYPGNRLIAEKLAEVEAAASAGGQEGSIGSSGADLLDGSFDLGSQIPDELAAAPGSAAASKPRPGRVMSKDVFEQFKAGVTHQIEDGDADTHFDLGVAYKEMGLVEDAVAEFEIARENPEREALAQTMIGNCYAQAGQLSEAINAYKRGLYSEKKTPAEEIELYYALGTTYLALSDRNEALYYLQKVAKREPNFRDVAVRLASLQSGS
jgi:tetratricopeptide (TPR) repeat protein